MSLTVNQPLFVFGNYPQISQKILEYLLPQESLELALSCKTIQSSINPVIENNKDHFVNIWKSYKSPVTSSDEEEAKIEAIEANLKKEKKSKKKSQNAQQNKKWIKHNFYELDEQTKRDLASFKHCRPSTELEGFDNELQEKFMNENQNSFFINDLTNQLIIINRSMVDQSLNLELNSTQEGDSKYYDIFTSEAHSQANYDFSNPKALLERQKQILESYKKKQTEKEASQDITPKIESILGLKKIAVILCHGGYFSIGIFEKDKCILHKSDHKYVVRKKAGKRQISKDSNSGSNIQSMGSQIRRDQEKKHAENIKKILTENTKQIKECDVVFYFAPSVNKYLILEENGPVWELRSKFRSICLTPKRANYTEVERIYKHITKVYIIPAKRRSVL